MSRICRLRALGACLARLGLPGDSSAGRSAARCVVACVGHIDRSHDLAKSREVDNVVARSGTTEATLRYTKNAAGAENCCQRRLDISQSQPPIKDLHSMFSSPVHYSREGTPGWKIKNWDAANKLLSYLDPKVRSFAIFERDDRSYVQCAGAKRGLTVEARVYGKRGKFKHYRFGRGEPVGRMVSIRCSVGPIRVDETQLLQLRDARIIMRQFLEEGTFPDKYVATEIGQEFT